MDAGPNKSQLSEHATIVLEMISAGCSYEQILTAHPQLTYLNIFDAAQEALDLSVPRRDPGVPAYKVSEIRNRYPRAYDPWTTADDELLERMIDDGLTVAQIAGQLERNRGAIRSRILKRNLIDRLSPREQARLHRISAMDPKDR